MMERVGCKECTSPYCHGCNLLMLEQMLKSGKFDALMDEKRGIKTGIDVRPVVRGAWEWNKNNGFYYCSKCGTISPREDQDGEYCDCPNFCPNCGADMRPQPPKEE